MKFNCNVKVVDMIMGSGKTSSAINYINNIDDDEKIMFITPYEKERDRIIQSCPSKHIRQPKTYGTKLVGIKELISKGYNISSTHSLFHRFDEETIDMCRTKNYTLILDEVTNVIEKYDISYEDFETLKREYVTIDSVSGILQWKEDKRNYHGKFSEEKRLCELGCLALYSENILMRLFPIEAFNAFKNIYILTYMFNAQIQRYYYDFYNLTYEYIYVAGNTIDTFKFVNKKEDNKSNQYNFKNLIHIIDNKKMNEIGEREYDLSKSWYRRNKDNIVMKQLKNNLYNYFRNIQNSNSSQNLWTCFIDFKRQLNGKGYSKGFLEVNARATNKFKERINIAYPVNRYLNTGIKNFFIRHGVNTDEDGFALSEMLQYIWRSAIREGNEIWVYIPSNRMRSLLIKWIDSNDSAIDI